MSAYSEYFTKFSSANNNNYSIGDNTTPPPPPSVCNSSNSSSSSSASTPFSPWAFDNDMLMQQMLFDMQIPPLFPLRPPFFDYPPIMQPSPFNRHRIDSSSISNNNSLYSPSLFDTVRQSPPNQSRLIAESIITNRYYKTALCHAWQETGSCAFGILCRYAHGDIELRSIQMRSRQNHHHSTSSRVRTRLCFHYSLYGNCTRGNQCKFVHYDGDDPIGTLRTAVDGNCQRSMMHHRGPIIRTIPIGAERLSSMNMM